MKKNITIDTAEKKIKAWLVSVFLKNQKKQISRNNFEKQLDELSSLLNTLDVKTAGKTVAAVEKPSSAFFTGRGKVEEIIKNAKETEADIIVFDDDLSPAQQKNWEKESGLKVIDRREIIINIFTERAMTKEAALQAKLARYQYFLPRLTGAWQHFSKQRGGSYGTRGEGEKQIELDKRILREKIAKLKEELKTIEKQRETRRKKRSNAKIFSCAIAGYTNAGKSTLINKLTGSNVSANNRLFDTLDPTVRKLRLPSGKELVITDTVGFIRKLPHQLIEAFKSTLEETVIADMVILLLDASNIEVKSHYETSLEVLKEIGVEKDKIFTVFNKADLYNNHLTDSISISALNGTGIDSLLLEIEKRIVQKEAEKSIELQ